MNINTDYFYFARLLLQSYRQTKFSVLMLMGALIIATSGLSAVLIINHSAKQSYQQDNTYLLPNVSHQIVAVNSSQKLTKQDYAELKKRGFNELVAYATSKHRIYHNNALGLVNRVSVTGIDFVSALTMPGFQQGMQGKQTSPDVNLLGLAFSSDVAFSHPRLLANLAPASGTTNPKLTLDSPQGPILPRLQAFDNAGLGNDVVLDINRYFSLLPEAELSGLLWVSQSPQHNDARLSSLSAQLPKHLTVLAMTSGEQQGELTESFHLNLFAMALLMFVVCLFIVLNAVNLLLNARMPWLKISRQLGIGRKAVFMVQIAELVLFNLVACSLGIVLGIYLANLVSPTVQATLANLYNVDVGFGHVSFWSLFVQVLAISLLGSLAALALPVIQLNKTLSHVKTPPLGSKQQRQWQIVTFGLALLLALVSFLLLSFATQLWLLLIAVACLILCGCALLLISYSAMLSIFCRFIPARLVLLRLSVKQSIALSSKAKIACCAFFIAATSNIGMNLMVDSFRAATLSWLDTRLVADYYLYYTGDTDLSQLAKQENIGISKRYEKYIDYQGLRIQLYSYPSTDTFKHAMVFYQINDKTQAWQNFENHQGVFVNQQFAFYYHVGLGDTVRLSHPISEQLTSYKIEGVVYDFGSPNKQVLLPISSFDAKLSASSLYALEGSPEQIRAFSLQLGSYGIDVQNNLIKTAELLARSMQTFDRTFLITDGLNVVTLLVAALSLACAIVVLSKDLKPQNMLIRSLGVSKFKLQIMGLFQFLLLCLVALIFATPFGILLSWVLINDVNYHAFQWTYPLKVDVFTLLNIYVVSLSVVLLIILIPTFKASRKPLIEDIRWLN